MTDDRVEQLEAELAATTTALHRLVFILRDKRLLAAVEEAALWDDVEAPAMPVLPSDAMAKVERGTPPRRRSTELAKATSPAPVTRSQAGRLGALVRWSQEEDRSAATQPARDGLQRRFEREVDPDGVLPPAELAKRAESARRAHFQRLALKSAQARRARRGVVEGEGRRDDGD